MRINKFLSDSGLGSRRGVEEFVTTGRVKINGETASLSSEVNPEIDLITMDGEKVNVVSEKIYFMLNKPKGFITSVSDDKGRKTVMEFIPPNYRKLVVPVGRLDYDSEGLLLFTNDGEFTMKLTHPKSKIAKVYVVKIEGILDNSQLETLRNGVYIDNKKTMPASVRVLESNQKLSRIEITITEGRNRQIRKMFEAVGKFVKFLKRTQIGDLRLGGMSRGECKVLSKNDIQKVFNKPEFRAISNDKNPSKTVFEKNVGRPNSLREPSLKKPYKENAGNKVKPFERKVSKRFTSKDSKPYSSKDSKPYRNRDEKKQPINKESKPYENKELKPYGSKDSKRVAGLQKNQDSKFPRVARANNSKPSRFKSK